MQRIFTISTALLYLALSIGVNLNLHYCQAVIKDVHVDFLAVDQHADLCHQELPGCCENEKPGETKKQGCEDCCNFIQESYKIEIDQNSTTFIVPGFTPALEFNQKLSFASNNLLDIQAGHLVVPKPDNGIPIFLKGCSFIFYG